MIDLKRTLNYQEKIALSNLNHMMSMTDLMDISLETPRIDSRCCLEKEFTKLICIRHDHSVRIVRMCAICAFCSLLRTEHFQIRTENRTHPCAVRYVRICANFVSRTLIFSKEINSVYSRGRDQEK